MNDELYGILLKLPKKNLIHLMLDALDLMEQFNGRTKMYCILTSMGAQYIENKSDGANGRYRVPSVAQIKRNTDDCPLY